MKYGTGKAADNICVYCGRGGARSFAGGGRAHSKCIDKPHKAKAYPCKDRQNCKYPNCDCGMKKPVTIENKE